MNYASAIEFPAVNPIFKITAPVFVDNELDAYNPAAESIINIHTKIKLI